MKGTAVARVLVVSLMVSACSEDAAPRDQWLITVSTDAPLPLFGDRLFVELLDEHGEVACANCRHHFDASSDATLPLSFGVDATSTPLRVRARLYRAELVVSGGMPAAGRGIDEVVRLPPASEVETLLLELHSNCFGIDPDVALGESCDPRTRALAPERLLEPLAGRRPVEVGSWPPAVPVDCPTAPPDTMVCMPGGVFLLGLPHPVFPAPFVEGPERVVQLPPFFLDQREVTVGDVKAKIAEGLPLLPGTVLDNPKCTFDPNTSANDTLPVTCVDHAFAAGYCEWVGARMPTEAEWEYAATNTGRETLFPWGDDPDICAHAHVARGTPDDVIAGDSSGDCHDASSAGHYGPKPEGNEEDVTSLAIRNLGGNVAELVDGFVTPFDAPCWSPEQFPLVSPKCTSVDDVPLRAVRGGSWDSIRDDSRSAQRGAIKSGSLTNAGFRCAH